MRNAECEGQNTECGMRRADCGMRRTRPAHLGRACCPGHHNPRRRRSPTIPQTPKGLKTLAQSCGGMRGATLGPRPPISLPTLKGLHNSRPGASPWAQSGSSKQKAAPSSTSRRKLPASNNGAPTPPPPKRPALAHRASNTTLCLLTRPLSRSGFRGKGPRPSPPSPPASRSIKENHERHDPESRNAHCAVPAQGDSPHNSQ